MNTLTQNEFEKYKQQINLQGIGEAGQVKLKSAKVACVGAGGLGSPLLLYLAAAGVGTLGIIDDDKIELSNLHRQILYSDSDLGFNKAETVSKKLAALKIDIHPVRLNIENAEAILSQYDIIADCSDNFSTRFLLNDICYKLDKPLVSASIHQFEGQCMTMHGNRGACLRCLFPDLPPQNQFDNCEQAGVLNVLPGLLGILQATEILKYILQLGDLLIGRVLMVNILKMKFREFQLPKNPHCDLCVNQRIMRDYSEPCTRCNTMNADYLISVTELNELMQKSADIQLVDVRALEKHLAFNIGGKHIPTAELPNRFNELDPAKPVITYCTSGGNSMRALQFLLSAGFKSVKSLDGGMTAWQAMGI